MSENNTGGAAPSETAELHQNAIPGDEQAINAAAEVEDTLDTDDVVEETPAEKIARKKKYALKVNNKIKNIELDLDNDEEIQKYLQKAMAADEKFEEAAMTRKQAEALVEMLRRDPLKVLAHPELGVDIKALAHKVINEELEEATKSPEQKRLEEMERKLKEYEENEKKSAEEKRKAELEKFELEQAQMLDEQITGALSTSTLPKSPYVVKRIADAMIEAVNLGYENVTADQVMPFVEQSIRREMAEMFGAAPDQVVEELVGKGRLDKYRKERVARAKKSVAAKVQDSGASAKKDEKKTEEKPLKFKDIFGQF